MPAGLECTRATTVRGLACRVRTCGFAQQSDNLGSQVVLRSTVEIGSAAIDLPAVQPLGTIVSSSETMEEKSAEHVR